MSGVFGGLSVFFFWGGNFSKCNRMLQIPSLQFGIWSSQRATGQCGYNLQEPVHRWSVRLDKMTKCIAREQNGKRKAWTCMGSILTCLKFKAMATYRCFYSTPSPRKIGVYSFAFHCHDLDMLYQLRCVACSGCGWNHCGSITSCDSGCRMACTGTTFYSLLLELWKVLGWGFFILFFLPTC